MKLIGSFITIILFSSSLIGQSESTLCGFESFHETKDPVLQKIEASTPTEFIKTFTISNNYKINTIETEKLILWIIFLYPNGYKLKLKSNQDYNYNCETNEIELINSNLIVEESKLEIHWFCRN